LASVAVVPKKVAISRTPGAAKAFADIVDAREWCSISLATLVETAGRSRKSVQDRENGMRNLHCVDEENASK
jgi:predicted transcriptional regulator